jgi:hypothetical protein
MKVKEFDFSFTENRKKYQASAMEITGVSNYPMIRVAVPRELTKEIIHDIYILYHIEAPGEIFYWFPTSGDRQERFTAISKALTKVMTDL